MGRYVTNNQPLCGMCGNPYPNHHELKCSICKSSVHLARTSWGNHNGEITMSYDYYCWRIGVNTPPTYVRVSKEKIREEDLDRSEWILFVNADMDADGNLVNWLKNMDSKSLKTYEDVAMDMVFANWTHRRIVIMLFQIAKIFAGSRSKTALFSLLIEMGQLVTDVTVRLKNQKLLSTPIGFFARTMTTYMIDTEVALERNLIMEKLDMVNLTSGNQ